MEKLNSSWTIASLWSFFLMVVVLQLGIRIIMSALAAIEWSHNSQESFWTLFWRNVRGFHPRDSGVRSDFWFPSILGFIELTSYPVLMATGAWSVIGAWIGFKTVAQWNHWKENRSSFNRFLIGNAAVAVSSLLVLAPYVIVRAS